MGGAERKAASISADVLMESEKRLSRSEDESLGHEGVLGHMRHDALTRKASN